MEQWNGIPFRDITHKKNMKSKLNLTETIRTFLLCVSCKIVFRTPKYLEVTKLQRIRPFMNTL